jgi:uncharacterized protein YjbJ (UPF0337 family)
MQCIEFHNIFSGIRMHGAAMDWDRISGNWAHWRGRIRERWGRLTNDELDVIAGRREQLVGRIQSAYGIQKVEAERQLRNWQRNLEVEVEQAELSLDDDGASEVNGRG